MSTTTSFSIKVCNLQGADPTCEYQQLIAETNMSASRILFKHCRKAALDSSCPYQATFQAEDVKMVKEARRLD